MHFAPPKASRASNKPRHLWIHAGLHKTGTTSLQSFLVQNRDTLAAQGLLYVRAGTNPYLNGNHNVAWELTGDRRFELDTGCLEEAAQEIADFDGDAILSSEDFESLLHRPQGFDPLLRHDLLRRHQVTIVIYVRNQAEYLASLLAENRKHGIEHVEDYLNRILEDGRLSAREWVFQFDLAALGKVWPHRNSKLLVRNYHTLAGGSTVTDFLGMLEAKGMADEDVRLNQASEPVRLSDQATSLLMARFAEGNRRICAKMKIAPDGLCTAPRWPEGAVLVG